MNTKAKERAMFINKSVSSFFHTLVEQGMEPMEINAVTVGMARKSMEDLIGVKEAIEMDKKWRVSIGWVSA